MKAKAAILVSTRKPLIVDEIEIPALRHGQVLVKILYSGICHTQIIEAEGGRGPDKYLPHCLGHEAVGEVVDTASGVTKVKRGQTVVISWMKGSGIDAGGTVYQWNKQSVNAGPVTTFQEYSVISENRLHPLLKGFSLQTAPLLGCAIPTGFGAVWNSLDIRPGHSIAILGAGGVGQFSIIASTTAGCCPIIAVDPISRKLNLARKSGADLVLKPGTPDLDKRISKVCPNGIDYAVVATGSIAAMEMAVRLVRPRGGKAVIVGNTSHENLLSLSPAFFNMGKSLLGTWGGDCRPDSDFPRFQEFILRRKIDLSAFTKKTYPLEKINTALDDLKQGRVLRPLICCGR